MLNVQNPWTGELMDCFIRTNRYVKGGGLFVGMLVRDLEYGFLEPLCDVTVNVPGATLSDENCAFVDTNDAPFIEAALKEYGLAEPTGRMAFSGWCSYPEYRFNLEELEKHGEE